MSLQDFTMEELELCFERNPVPKSGHGIIAINYHNIANMILQHVPMATIIETKQICSYVKGHYVNNGEEVIHKILVTLLGPQNRENGQTCYNSHVLKEVIGIIQGLTYVEAKQFDNNLDIINCTNGLLNWRTGELKPHRPSYYSRIQLNVNYDPDAVCPNILKVYETVLRKEDFRKALEFIGYCLYRSYPIQKAFILLGPGGTGKSHFIDTVCKMLGDDTISSVSMHDLERDRFATSDLYCKLLNSFGDMEQSTLPNVNILKMLTSNKDVIRAQKKGEKAFEFINYAKLIFASNKLPKVRDDTSGFYRRVEIIPFEHVFTREEQEISEADGLFEKITSPEELSGLLNLVLPHLNDLLERGFFHNSFTTATAKDTYKRASEPIASFVELYLDEVADVYVAKQTIYEEFCKFCIQNGIAKERKDVLHIVPFGKILRQCVPWYQTAIRGPDEINACMWPDDNLRHPVLINTVLKPVRN